jgi:hypothetical protein
LTWRQSTLESHSSLSLAACGGGSDGVSENNQMTCGGACPASIQATAGIWQGSSSENGTTVNTAALVAEDGSFYAYEENTSTGCAAVLTGFATASGSTVSGTIQAALVSVAENTSIQTTCVYSDGSTWATGSLSGTVVKGSTITITPSLTTANGTPLSSVSETLSFNAMYNQTSAINDLAGNWTGATGVVTAVSATGMISAHDPTSGCTVSGQYSVLDPSVNVYSGSVTYADGQGDASVLNGSTASGLVTLDTSISPNELIGGMSLTLPNGTVVVAVASSTRS